MSEAKLNAVTALAEMFGRKMTRPAVKLYVAALNCLDDKQVERAAVTAAEGRKFMPTPSELIELARTGGVSYEAQAAVSWEELERALNANQPSLMSPITAAVARQLGGFASLREIPLKEFSTWKRKDFLASYTTLSKENPERLAAITGPSSEIAKALQLNRIETREQLEQRQEENRKKLLALKD